MRAKLQNNNSNNNNNLYEMFEQILSYTVKLLDC